MGSGGAPAPRKTSLGVLILAGAVIVLLVSGILQALIQFGARSAGDGTSPPGGGGTGPTPPVAVAPVPAAPHIAATREACVAFLLQRASVASAPPGDIGVYPAVRMAALEALATLRPEGWQAALDKVLGGDGDPEDWTEVRLLAAGIAIAAGDARGEATLKAFLAQEPDDLLFDTEAVAAAAEAAVRLPAPQAARVIARILAEDPDDFDDEELARIGRAAASLEALDAAASLRKIFGEDLWDMEARGAAAGALLRGGDAAGEALVRSVETGEDTLDGEDLASGLGAPGNADVLPWLRRLAAVDDPLIRPAAVRAMGVVGVAGAREDLAKALGDEDQDVRHEAAIALTRMGDPAGLPATRAAARENGDADLRVRAWRALAEAGDAGAVDLAREVLARALPADSKANTHARYVAALEKVWAARLVAARP